jgi:hypothetical protein
MPSEALLLRSTYLAIATAPKIPIIMMIMISSILVKPFWIFDALASCDNSSLFQAGYGMFL